VAVGAAVLEHGEHLGVAQQAAVGLDAFVFFFCGRERAAASKGRVVAAAGRKTH
jgi:hypothetical protein